MKPIYKIFVTIDKRFQDEVTTESGLVLYKDTSFNQEENSTTVGIVAAIPDKYDRAMGTEDFKANVQIGDKLYFNFLVTVDEENRIEVDGKEYWMVDYFQAIALVRDGEVKPVGDYILIEPVEEKIESSLIIPDVVNKEKTRGRVFASNHPDLEPGDEVEYEDIGKFWNIIEGKRVYCMFITNVLFKYGNVSNDA